MTNKVLGMMKLIFLHEYGKGKKDFSKRVFYQNKKTAQKELSSILKSAI